MPRGSSTRDGQRDLAWPHWRWQPVGISTQQPLSPLLPHQGCGLIQTLPRPHQDRVLSPVLCKACLKVLFPFSLRTAQGEDQRRVRSFIFPGY